MSPRSDEFMAAARDQLVADAERFVDGVAVMLGAAG